MENTKGFDLEFIASLEEGIEREACAKNCLYLEGEIIRCFLELQYELEFTQNIEYGYLSNNNTYQFQISLSFSTETNENTIEEIKTEIQEFIKGKQELPWYQVKDNRTYTTTSFPKFISNTLH